MSFQTIMPRLGFGTYGRTGPDGVAAMLSALEVGHRHLDTAQSYGTERGVGEAIRRSGLQRDAVFVTTKITAGNLGAGALIPSLERSLEELRLDHVDLTLIHWPAPNGEIPLPVYVEQLAEAKENGLTRWIGVSNFTIALVEEARRLLGEGQIATNQVELNPLFRNKKLADHCVAAGILVTCYQPIAQGRLGTDPVLQRIAERHGATPEQIGLAFELANGYAAIPTSGNPDRIRANFESRRIALSQAEIAEIETLDRGQRSIDPDWGPDWD
jgi:2,5-diketo-D-gluconate reductase B